MNDSSTSEGPSRGRFSRTITGGGGSSRLLRRTFVVAFILVSGGLIASGSLELFFRYRESVENIRVLQQEIAQGAAYKIQQFVQAIEKTMQAFAQTQEIVTPGLTESYRLQLFKLLKAAFAITTVAALDANGREQIRESRLHRIRPEDLKGLSSDEAFAQARSGKSFFGPLHFVRESEPYMSVAVPIERFSGEVIGALIAEVNLKYIWEVISQVKVGRTGYAYVVSHEGDLIAHPDISLVLQKRNLRELSQVQTALAEESGSFVAQLNLAGQKVFSAYAPIPDLGWVVLVEQPAREAYALLYPSILRSAVLLLLGLGVAVVASLLISRRVVRPVEVLRQGAARIGAGALNHRIDVRTGDELEALAGDLNRMATQLYESYASLERKVEERTQELKVSNQRLDEASQHKSQFLANVNHELRTPVSAIMGYGRLVLRKTEGQIHESQRRNLQKLLNTAEQLLDLINSLLDLSKIESGRMELRSEPVKVDDLIREASSTVEPMLKDGSVQLIREIGPGIPTLKTDREKLRQVIVNLLSNAVKYTEQGKIKILAFQQGGSLKLAVSDTGVGIEKGDLNYIFEEFRQGDISGTMNYRGTGLGLAIVKKYVTLLGGDVGVESEVGKGSTFTVTLPLRHRTSVPGLTREEHPA